MNNSIVDYLNSQGKASDFATRKTLAESNGISGYSGTAEQNISLLNKLRTTPAPTQNSAIAVDQLSTPKTIQTPQIPKDTTDYGNYSKTGMDVLSTDLATLTKQRDDARTQRQNDAKDIIKSMEYISGNKTTDTRNAEISSGVDAETTKLNSLIDELTGYNAEMKALDREATAIPLQVQNEVAGQGVTDAGAAPDITGRLRNNALKALTIAQKADITSAAATGSLSRLNLAKEKAQQIVDLKYKPLEDTLNIKLKQYELNKDILDEIDKDRSEALASSLNAQKAELEQKKADEKAKMDLITGAAPFAPQDLLEKARNAPDATSAAIILGQYGKDYLATQKTKQEIIKLQIENGTYNEETGISALLTKENGFSIQDFKRGIESVESRGSGGYSALGPVMTTGAYAGDRAYGKYQVMGGNIPAWTKSALGFSATPQQFLANPEYQEKVFEDQVSKSYAKYGNWDDVASVWFSGQPLANNKKSDGYNSTQQYVAKVRKGMGVTEPTQISIPGVPEKVINNVSSGRIMGGQVVSYATGDVPKNVTSDKQDGLLALRDLVNKTAEYKKLYTDLQNEGATGVFGTGVVKGVKNFVVPGVNATALETLRNEITDLLARARSGAALTAYETAQYEAKLPTSWSADQVFGNPQTKIDGLQSSLSNTLNSKMQGYGVIFAPTIEEIYAKRMDAAMNGGTSTGSDGAGNGDNYGYY